MKHLIQKIQKVKHILISDEEVEKKELMGMCTKAYSIAAYIFTHFKARPGQLSNFRSDYCFRSLHHLEYVLQKADEIEAAGSPGQLRTEFVTALNLVLVILEDEEIEVICAEAS